ncbi:MAG: DNA primase [Bacteroidia bacterium]
MISKEDIDKIFDAARIEEVVGDHVNLKKRGVNLIGVCPFHDEKTPSFYVSPVKGIYKCFGCGKGGNAVNFVMDYEKITYPEALRKLAQKYQIEITEKELTPEQQQSNSERESLLVVSSFAQKKFTENLFNTDEGKSVGLGYFRERGFRDDIVQKFQLGYSMSKRSAFTDAAIAEGYKTEYLVKSGLTIEYKNEEEHDGNGEHPEQNKNNVNHADRFWGRVMFPIHSASGRVIAFGGRTLRTDKKVAKYVNSPESEIYHKSDVLYGLYFAKGAIAKHDNCFLVEGYTDVISLFQAGIENVVSSSGTSLTAGQIKLLRRHTTNITVMYDGDSAGIKAALRGIDLLLEEGLNVKVLLFPDGEDPDSYSKRVSHEELLDFIAKNSRDFISFKTSLLMNEVGHDPIKKAGLIKDVVSSIALIPDAIYRSVYVKECSKIMDIEEQVLLNELNKIRSVRFNEKHNNAEPQPEEINVEELILKDKKQQELDASAEYQERDIIRLLLNYGKKTIFIDGDELDVHNNPIPVEVHVTPLLVHELDNDKIVFENPLYKAIYAEIVEYLNNDIIHDYNHFINHQNNEIAYLTVDLISSPYSLSKWEEHSIYPTLEEHILKKSVYHAIYALKSRKLEMMIHDNQKKLKENLPEEEMILLMQTQQQLLEAKKMFNTLLGRIILK